MVLQRGFACICALREIGANKCIAQFANWTMNTAPRCSIPIRIPASDKNEATER